MFNKTKAKAQKFGKDINAKNKDYQEHYHTFLEDGLLLAGATVAFVGVVKAKPIMTAAGIVMVVAKKQLAKTVTLSCATGKVIASKAMPVKAESLEEEEKTADEIIEANLSA